MQYFLLLSESINTPPSSHWKTPQRQEAGREREREREEWVEAEEQALPPTCFPHIEQWARQPEFSLFLNSANNPLKQTITSILGLHTSHSWLLHAVIRYVSWEIQKCTIQKNGTWMISLVDDFLRYKDNFMSYCTKSKSNWLFSCIYICFKLFCYFKKPSFKAILNHSGPLEKAMKLNYFCHSLLLRFAETDASY